MNTFKKRCFLPKIRDVYDVVFPVFFLSKILGLAPFRFDNSARRFIPHCGPLIIMRFVAVIGAMAYVAVLIYDPNPSINIGWFALRCEIYFGTIITSIVLVLAVVNQRMLIKAIENIIEIDKLMGIIGINITYKNAQRFAYFQIIGITCVFSSKLILQIFASRKNKFVYNVFNVVDYINTIMLFQFVDMLLLLRQRYIWLNRNIRFVMRTNYGRHHVVPAKESFVSHVVIHSDYRMEYIPFKKLIRYWGKIHSDLYKTAKLINRTYGVQILATMCARFVMITTQLINVYKHIQDPKQGSVNTYVLIATYLFLHSSKLFVIASISENTASKGKDTGIYLHKLWDFNDSMKEEINFLSLQILHQDLNFTAAGFFVLDYTLIHSIIAAVTTYMIIIIQYDVTRTQ